MEDIKFHKTVETLIQSNEPAPLPEECSACGDEKPASEITHIESDAVCHECINEMFRNALKDESNYPVSWGGKRLEASDFEHILAADIREKLKRKAVEYETQWSERVYCTNNAAHPGEADIFLGQVLPGDTTAAEKHATCPECSQMQCLLCKEVIDGTLRGHVCNYAEVEAEFTKAFEGLTKGKEWQVCPGCKSGVELKDGCNHVACRCGAEFCFVCGQPARGNSSHWIRGSCPRYNHPESHNAIWEEELHRPRALGWRFLHQPPPPYGLGFQSRRRRELNAEYEAMAAFQQQQEQAVRDGDIHTGARIEAEIQHLRQRLATIEREERAEQQLMAQRAGNGARPRRLAPPHAVRGREGPDFIQTPPQRAVEAVEHARGRNENEGISPRQCMTMRLPPQEGYMQAVPHGLPHTPYVHSHSQPQTPQSGPRQVLLPRGLPNVVAANPSRGHARDLPRPHGHPRLHQLPLLPLRAAYAAVAARSSASPVDINQPLPRSHLEHLLQVPPAATNEPATMRERFTAHFQRGREARTDVQAAYNLLMLQQQQRRRQNDDQAVHVMFPRELLESSTRRAPNRPQAAVRPSRTPSRRARSGSGSPLASNVPGAQHTARINRRDQHRRAAPRRGSLHRSSTSSTGSRGRRNQSQSRNSSSHETNRHLALRIQEHLRGQDLQERTNARRNTFFQRGGQPLMIPLPSFSEWESPVFTDVVPASTVLPSYAVTGFGPSPSPMRMAAARLSPSTPDHHFGDDRRFPRSHPYQSQGDSSPVVGAHWSARRNAIDYRAPVSPIFETAIDRIDADEHGGAFRPTEVIDMTRGETPSLPSAAGTRPRATGL